MKSVTTLLPKTKKTLFISVLLLSVLGSGIVNILQPATSAALSGADFKPDNIISDSVFTNAGSMSAQDVQNFLNAKVPNCDTDGTQPSSHPNGSGGYYSRAQWGAMNGNSAPYTCLKNYVENTSNKQNNFYSPGTPVPGGSSAAQIIWNAAQQYRISPQVILVTLQKEQGLVTDDWPWYGEYRSAMGYGCPDTAACDAKYYGFFNQVDNAAWQFRYYLDHPNAFNYWIGNNYIQYNPNSSCGGAVVNILNAATAALYIYTPYQPNASSLARLSDSSAGGTGDGCGAYGNRNFWWYFNTWFGPSSPNFQASYAGQSRYPTIVRGNSSPAYLRYQNTGNSPWYDDVSAPQYNTYAVHLATTNPMNVGSPFSAFWPSRNRATGTFAHVYNSDGTTLASNQHVVLPTQIVEFDFSFSVAPNMDPNYYQVYFQPILEGSALWNMGGVAWLGVTVQPITFQASYAGQSAYPSIAKGQSSPAYFRFQNTGNMAWYDDVSAPQYKTYPVHLAATNPINRSSSFSAGWPTANRATGTFANVYNSDGSTLASNQHLASPGQIVEFDFNFSAPGNLASGYYQEFFQPVLEGSVFWNMNGAAWLGVTVH